MHSSIPFSQFSIETTRIIAPNNEGLGWYKDWFAIIGPVNPFIEGVNNQNGVLQELTRRFFLEDKKPAATAVHFVSYV